MSEDHEPSYQIPQKTIHLFLGLSTVAVGVLTGLLAREPGVEGEGIVGPVIVGLAAALIYISALQWLVRKYRK